MTLKWSSQYAPVDGDFSNVSILLLGEGVNGSTTIADSSSNAKTVTANGDAQVSTAVNTPFGTGDGVLAFDGTGDFLSTPASSDLNFGTGDFTVEAWVYHTGVVNQAIISYGTIHFLYGITGYLRVFNATSPSVIDSTVAYVSNAWVHVAVVRTGTNITLYQNGTNVGSGTSSVNYTSTGNFIVGSYTGTASFWNGYISNLRITKGVARYTENFDVPTAPFPIYSPTTRAQV